MGGDRPRGPGDGSDGPEKGDRPNEADRQNRDETGDRAERTEEELGAEWAEVEKAVREDRAKNPRRHFGKASTAEVATDVQVRPGENESRPEPEGRPEVDRGWQTITEEIGERKSWRSFGAAKRELGSVPGTQVHHVVEQAQGLPHRSGFRPEQINDSDNMARIPIEVHNPITARYNSKLPGMPIKLRDFMDDKSWEYQTEYGRDVLDKEMRNYRDSDD